MEEIFLERGNILQGFFFFSSGRLEREGAFPLRERGGDIFSGEVFIVGRGYILGKLGLQVQEVGFYILWKLPLPEEGFCYW